MNSRLPRMLAAAALLLQASAALAGDGTVAVLSSASGVYMEAFSSFQAEYGAEVPHLDASREKVALPAGTRTVVTFGTKAIAQQYPPEVNIVSCMAPGYFIKPQGREGRLVKISMTPGMERIISTFKRLQPGLRRLRVFWTVQTFGTFSEAMRQAGEAEGVQVTTVKVEDPEKLPGLLRGARPEMDAFWLPPDPLLITPDTLLIFREFSWSNGIPMYATTKGMAKDGACASVGVSFAESGAAAARAAKALQAGETIPALIYPEKVELTLNASAARKCGLQFPPELVREAAYLFP